MKTTNECLARKIVVMTCLAAVFGLAGCQKEDSAEKAEKKVDRAAENAPRQIPQTRDQAEQEVEGGTGAVTVTQATGEYADDSAITAKVKAAILNDPLLSDSNIEVTTDKGVVKLSGKVNYESTIARAVEVTNAQKGVKSVQSELIVTKGK